MFSNITDFSSARTDTRSAWQDTHSVQVERMSSCISDEMAAIVRGAAAPVSPGDTVGELIRRAARRLGLNHRRVRAYWYGEVKHVPAEEADRLRAARSTIVREQGVQLARALAECRADAADIRALIEELQRVS